MRRDRPKRRTRAESWDNEATVRSTNGNPIPKAALLPLQPGSLDDEWIADMESAARLLAVTEKEGGKEGGKEGNMACLALLKAGV
jgi:hypothetical protein